MLGSPQMAEVKPFRAERYDESKAGPLERLVAPPYDVISPEQREEYLARSPHNVVHLTLPDDEEQAGRDLTAWRDQGVLSRDPESGYWFLSQDYLGPDGSHRTRSGLVASLRAEPYENGAVLPHERTHRGPKEGRLRLLRATRTQLEPIFLLYEGHPLPSLGRAPDLQSGGDKLWRIDEAPAFEDTELLSGDGLDAEIVEQIAPEGVTYTPQRADAVATVDRGDAEAAFLLRPTRIEDVWAVARRGETMPQKSTYFYPKLTSGLLFHPLD